MDKYMNLVQVIMQKMKDVCQVVYKKEDHMYI